MCHVANVKVHDVLTLKDQAVGNVEAIMSPGSSRETKRRVRVCVSIFFYALNFPVVTKVLR